MIASCLDLETISTLQEIMPDEYQEIVALFIETTPEQIQSMRTHYQQADRSSFVAVVHTVKGASGNIGASRLFEECERLEDGMRSNVISDASQHIDLIERLYHETRDEFLRILSS